MSCHYSTSAFLAQTERPSMVYYTLVILLHRPFVETAASMDPSIVTICWSRCEEAAKGTTALLKRYRAAFTLARAPYLIVRYALGPSLMPVIRHIRRGNNSRQDRGPTEPDVGSEPAVTSLYRGPG